MDLLSQLQPRRMPGEPEPDETPAQPAWPAQGAQGAGWPPAPGFGEGFPKGEGPSVDWARPSAQAAQAAQSPAAQAQAAQAAAGKNNPFKKASPSGPDWAMPAQARGEAPPPMQGFPDAPFPAFPGPRPTSASNPFRKEDAGWPGDLDAFQSVRPASKDSARAAFPDPEGRGQDASALAPQDLMAGARFAKESGMSAQDMMAGAQFAQKSGVTSQHPGWV